MKATKEKGGHYLRYPYVPLSDHYISQLRLQNVTSQPHLQSAPTACCTVDIRPQHVPDFTQTSHIVSAQHIIKVPIQVSFPIWKKGVVYTVCLDGARATHTSFISRIPVYFHGVHTMVWICDLACIQTNRSKQLNKCTLLEASTGLLSDSKIWKCKNKNSHTPNFPSCV